MLDNSIFLDETTYFSHIHKLVSPEYCGHAGFLPTNFIISSVSDVRGSPAPTSYVTVFTGQVTQTVFCIALTSLKLFRIAKL